jgi:hypothetical protein
VIGHVVRYAHVARERVTQAAPLPPPSAASSPSLHHTGAGASPSAQPEGLARMVAAGLSLLA